MPYYCHYISITTLASNKNKLKQSAGQMLVLRILPFVLDSFKINAYIQVILDLTEIDQILFAPVITLGTIKSQVTH